jgi:hypothetical protein
MREGKKKRRRAEKSENINTEETEEGQSTQRKKERSFAALRMTTRKHKDAIVGMPRIVRKLSKVSFA